LSVKSLNLTRKSQGRDTIIAKINKRFRKIKLNLKKKNQEKLTKKNQLKNKNQESLKV
jgi:hypothetical protein